MVKLRLFIIGLIITLAMPGISLAAEADTEPKNVQDASFQTRCLSATKMGFPECADSPAECKSGTKEQGYRTPFNCLFIQEPIGGRTGYDLYKIVTLPDGHEMYTLWYGEALVGKDQGPIQAVLAYEEGKEVQGPFTLLYNYMGLVYNFLSGIIVAVVILIVIVGGIRISAAGGNAEGGQGGKDMIIKALIGMVLWFTASVILYTVNPTFFAF